jgi:DNA-binding helix-hairpin-helix protein with protein kinase domain
VSDAQLADLGPCEQIGDGGQGTVHRLSRLRGHLLKRYHPHVAVDADELDLLIRSPMFMTEHDRGFVLATTAWPTARVYDGGACVGFLMPEAPARFSTELAGRPVLRELQYLVYRQRKMWSALRLPSSEERQALVRAYVHLFQVLHRYGVVIGDVSMRNLLWTLEGRPSVYAIDCDGFRLDGRAPAVPQAQTPEWADPAVNSGMASFDSDRYKLALLVARVLLSDPRVTPEAVVASPELRSRFRPGIMGLLDQASRPGQRPPADSWVRVLEGRPTLTVERAPAPPRGPQLDAFVSSASHPGPGVQS